jgi:hypothetical protein
MFPANGNYIGSAGVSSEVPIGVTERQAMGKAPGCIQKAGGYEKKAAGFGQNPAPFVCPAVYFLQAKQENQKKL